MYRSIARITTILAGITGFIVAIIFFLTSTPSLSAFYPPLESSQVDALLLLLISSMVLFTLFDRYFSLEVIDKKVRKIEYLLAMGEEPTSSETHWKILAKLFNMALFTIILTQTIYIGIIDLLGGFPGSIFEPGERILLLKKISLLLFGVIFVGNVLIHGREKAQKLEQQMEEVSLRIRDFKDITKITLTKRREFGETWLTYLKNLEPSSEIYLTHFEEPMKKMKRDGYYYGKEFMEKFYQLIDRKNMIVNLIILLNRPRDYEDLLKRLKRVSSIEHFYINVIIAPPPSMYFDFLTVPNQLSILATSDDHSNPNLNTISIETKNLEMSNLLYKMFVSNLLPRSIPIRTKEGFHKKNLEYVKNELDKIAKSRSKKLRQTFKINNSDSYDK